MARLESLIYKAFQHKSLGETDIVFLLQLREKEHVDALFAAARTLRKQFFQDSIFLYGFLYISTHCRNNCNFCFYRASNNLSPRRRKEQTDVVQAAVSLARSGVHSIDLTMGEDPSFHADLVRLVEGVKAAVDLPIMISPGVLADQDLKALAEAGADWFACYQETHNRGLFQRLRPGQDYDTRMESKRAARRHGFLIEEGILVGIGETPGDIANSLAIMRHLEAHQVRAMNFVPQQGTPMANRRPAAALTELLAIAVMRLMFPHALIPATLDVEGLDGLKHRLGAGANVVTSIVPPRQGLTGVVQSFLDIDDARRTCGGVLPVLEECGLRAADPAEYAGWMREIKKTNRGEWC
jgi:methylornithine synthase